MEVEKELRKLSGRWVQVSSNDDGVDSPIDEFGPEPTTVISDNSFEVFDVDGNSLLKGYFILFPEENPKAIDWHDETGEDAGKTIPAIYKIEAGVFMFSAANPGMSRPKDFNPGSGYTIRVFKRI